MEEQAPPRVTALIVSRHSPVELRRCLESLERSEERDRLEILVVDDGSRDGTTAVLDDFPDVISLKLPKRFGWTRAVNIALRTAKGNLVFLLPVWFEVAPDTVRRLANRLEESADTGAVCPRVDRAWPFPSAADLDAAWKTGELPGARTLGATAGEQAVEYPMGSPVMTRRELLRAMNYLDERFGDRWSDLEMYWRIRDGGKSILVLSDVVAPLQATDSASQGDDELSPLEWIDSAHGVGTWIGLHQGGMKGFTTTLSMAFHALGKGRTSAFLGILTGSKIDGNQE